MSDDLLNQAWEAVWGAPPPEAVPASLLEALPHLLPPAAFELGAGYNLDECMELPPDVWREMIVFDRTEPRLAWVFEAAQLFVIGRGPDDSWLAVDTDDASGSYPTYEIAATGHEARMLLPTIASLYEWIASPGSPPEPTANPSAGDAGSLESCLTALWQLHPVNFFAAHCAGAELGEPDELPEYAADVTGWRRLAIIWTLDRFRKTREVALPKGLKREMISDPHLTLGEYLHDLAEALEVDDVPAVVAELSLDEDPEIADAAVEWMARFDDVRQDEPEEPPSDLAEKTRGLLELLNAVVAELISQEHIEVEEEQLPKLAEQLLEAVIKAGSPKAAVPALIDKLLDSRNVEEVFADDAQLERVIAKALGMGA